MTPRVAVVYHSRRGTMRSLAEAAAAGAQAYGAQVRLLHVADDEAGPAWPDEEAGPEDVLWADGLVLASPTYFGNVSAPFKRFLDGTTKLWCDGLLNDRVVTGMTASTCLHGGREATLLALYQSAHHWGAWTVGAGPAHRGGPAGPAGCGVGGNPYGLAVTALRDGSVAEHDRAAARELGGRLAGVAARARSGGRPAPDAAVRSRVAVVHCAEDETVRLLAQECAAGARELGAEVRLRRLTGPGVRRESGLPGRAGGAPAAAAVDPADVAWADSVVLGAPVRAGAVAAPLLGFLQSLEPPAGPGPLAGKPAGGFVSTARPHAGSESALLSLHHVLHHCGAVVVPPGYTDPVVFEAGGNPYGTSHARSAGVLPTVQALAAARHQGRRAALAGDRLRRRPAPDAGVLDTPLEKELT
ncbi:flavodoxin family protein [Streptomyces rectiverticillatus]|uniref:flavodoxin family protein n=1 Tax=Streptomyces rectiverticillatus TaxID=173860 RepID=UPI0015C3A07B|nr:flavodoxin family protein [Streptomyces rectiverticillatus]QLE75360.1 flavodoxin family protein [Streptomyces rectiverticillatus]